MHSITFNSLLVLLLVSSNTVLSLNDAKFLGERSQILNNGVDSNQRLSRRESTDGVEGSHSKRRIRGLNHQSTTSHLVHRDVSAVKNATTSTNSNATSSTVNSTVASTSSSSSVVLSPSSTKPSSSASADSTDGEGKSEGDSEGKGNASNSTSVISTNSTSSTSQSISTSSSSTLSSTLSSSVVLSTHTILDPTPSPSPVSSTQNATVITPASTSSQSSTSDSIASGIFSSTTSASPHTDPAAQAASNSIASDAQSIVGVLHSLLPIPIVQPSSSSDSNVTTSVVASSSSISAIPAPIITPAPVNSSAPAVNSNTTTVETVSDSPSPLPLPSIVIGSSTLVGETSLIPGPTATIPILTVTSVDASGIPSITIIQSVTTLPSISVIVFTNAGNSSTSILPSPVTTEAPSPPSATTSDSTTGGTTVTPGNITISDNSPGIQSIVSQFPSIPSRPSPTSLSSPSSDNSTNSNNTATTTIFSSSPIPALATVLNNLTALIPNPTPTFGFGPNGTAGVVFSSAILSGSGGGSNSGGSDSSFATSTISRSSATASVPEWVPTSTLLGFTPSATPTAAPTTLTLYPAGAFTTEVDGKPSITITSAVTFPTGIPSKIVPPTTQAPVVIPDSTTVSVLFSNVLPWLWTIENSSVSGQLIVFTPTALADALNISPDRITTTSLNAFQPANYNGDPNTILTVWVGTIPSNQVDSLQAMLLDPSSTIYNLPGIEGQLMRSVIPTYSLLAYSSSSSSSSTDSNGASNLAQQNSTEQQDDNAAKTKSKNIIIAVVVSCGTFILLLAAFLAYRATKKGSIVLGRRNIGGGGNSNLNQVDPLHRRLHLHPSAPNGGRIQLRGDDDPFADTRVHSTSTQGRSYVTADGSLREPTEAERYRDSTSTSSSQSTGFSNDSRRHSTGGGDHGRSSSIDSDSPSRSSWWRFSSGSTSAGPNISSGAGFSAQQQQSQQRFSGGSHHHQQQQPEMREQQQHRRINIIRGPNGRFDSSLIGAPQIQSNSLML